MTVGHEVTQPKPSAEKADPETDFNSSKVENASSRRPLWPQDTCNLQELYDKPSIVVGSAHHHQTTYNLQELYNE
ncbi:hypothetical protein WN944_020664 [Citrus x changshan-huyou]|uniref:Uncharacterized protein n=1 Tax=Citrus x changshan-huyou TaxID=2935761 RepID=A0AAP0QH14_9ROSI